MRKIIVIVLLLVCANPSNAAISDVHKSCFKSTLSAIQNKIRWRVPAWSPAKIDAIGDAFISAGEKYGFSPEFLEGFAVNESDLRDDAIRVSKLKTGGTAIDGGLMGVRCILSTSARNHAKCTNQFARGLTWMELMRPAKNVEVGAKILAYLRDNPTPILLKAKNDKRRVVACPHRGHPFFAHYNWGTLVIEKGPSRHYPQRVAVLVHALMRATGTDAPEIADAPLLTLQKHSQGRYERLYEQITSCAGGCAQTAALTSTVR